MITQAYHLGGLKAFKSACRQKKNLVHVVGSSACNRKYHADGFRALLFKNVHTQYRKFLFYQYLLCLHALKNSRPSAFYITG